MKTLVEGSPNLSVTQATIISYVYDSGEIFYKESGINTTVFFMLLKDVFAGQLADEHQGGGV